MRQYKDPVIDQPGFHGSCHGNGFCFRCSIGENQVGELVSDSCYLSGMGWPGFWSLGEFRGRFLVKKTKTIYNPWKSNHHF